MKALTMISLLAILGATFSSCEKEKDSTEDQRLEPTDSVSTYYIELNDSTVIEFGNASCNSYRANKQQGGCKHDIWEVSAHGYMLVFTTYRLTDSDFSVADIANERESCDPAGIWVDIIDLELVEAISGITYHNGTGSIRFDYEPDTSTLEFTNVIFSSDSSSVPNLLVNGKVFCTH